MRRLKWRFVGTAHMILGGMSERNRAIIAPETNDEGEEVKPGFLSSKKPYMELGYGVENIFKFFRVDFIHRLSYTKDVPDVRKFGVFFSVQFTL
jgi:hypothetical protein